MSFISGLFKKKESMVSNELILPKLKKAIETDKFELFAEGMKDMLLQVGLHINVIEQIINIDVESAIGQNLRSAIFQPIRQGYLDHHETWSEEIRLNVGDGQSKLFVGVTDVGDVCVSFNDPHHMNADLGSRFNALK